MGEARRRLLAAASHPAAGNRPPTAAVIPADIKRDIAATVRSIEFGLGLGIVGGKCFFRTFAGYLTLRALDIPARFALGGMVYRTGPDEYRDVVAWCGPGNLGCRLENGHLLAHYFLTSGDDIVDFSVGDWRRDTEVVPDYSMGADLGPIQWMAEPPGYFWDSRAAFAPVPSAKSPAIGCAWYCGFAGDPPDWDSLIAELHPHLKHIGRHIGSCLTQFALKERLWAARNGHTAVRLSQIAAVLGEPGLLDGMDGDRLIVLRGAVDLTPQTARDLLGELADGAAAGMVRP